MPYDRDSFLAGLAAGFASRTMIKPAPLPPFNPFDKCLCIAYVANPESSIDLGVNVFVPHVAYKNADGNIITVDTIGMKRYPAQGPTIMRVDIIDRNRALFTIIPDTDTPYYFYVTTRMQRGNYSRDLMLVAYYHSYDTPPLYHTWDEVYTHPWTAWADTQSGLVAPGIRLDVAGSPIRATWNAFAIRREVFFGHEEWRVKDGDGSILADMQMIATKWKDPNLTYADV